MMSGTVPGSVWHLLILLLCIVITLHGHPPPEKGNKPASKTVEESLIKDLMKTVERHFEKLTARVTTLENTLSSMQFYSIRQFNQISGSLQNTNNDLGTVRKQLSQIEIDGRSQKITLSLLGRDVTELKKGSSDLLSELETSMVYMHESIEKQGSQLQTSLEDTVIKTVNENTVQFSRKIDDIGLKLETTQSEPANCTAAISSVAQLVDLRVTELKKQTFAHLVKLMNAAKLDLKKTLCAKDYREEVYSNMDKTQLKSCNCKNGFEKATSVNDELTSQSYITNQSHQKANINSAENTKSRDSLGQVGKHEETTSATDYEQITTHSNKDLNKAVPNRNGATTTDFINSSEYVTTPLDITGASTTQTSRAKDVTTHFKISGNTLSHISAFESTAADFSRSTDAITQVKNNEDARTNIGTSEYTVHFSTPDDSTRYLDKVVDSSADIPQNQNHNFQDEQDERVMNALYNMTNSVLQAVSYFRQTGRMLEQILSNTDAMVMSQSDLGRRFGAKEVEESDSSNLMDGSSGMGQQPYSSTLSRNPSGYNSDRAGYQNVATIVKNGSQLLEVLTDLAQLSSVSLAKATADVQDEVKRLEGIRTQIATAVFARPNSDLNPVSRLTNLTQTTFKLVEAVASNTKWLPLIFHSAQHVESVANTSLQIAKQNQEMLVQIQNSAAAGDFTKLADNNEYDPIFTNRIPHTLGQVEGMSYNEVNVSVTSEYSLSKESLEMIYSASLKLNRIMPALTKLLAEHDPLLTLVSGGKQDRGRVEIYHEGLWGTLCHGNLTHAEANLICRHLGFKGGISAGAGHFGPGSGVTWLFNVSCLGSNVCPVVTLSGDSSQCTHDLDAAVICDHMLRIVSPNGSTQGKDGRLEIHHRGAWLPVCEDGWTRNSARVACQQMGFSTGKVLNVAKLTGRTKSAWLGKTVCTGLEKRLDACHTAGWTDSCTGLVPAGVSCL